MSSRCDIAECFLSCFRFVAAFSSAGGCSVICVVFDALRQFENECLMPGMGSIVDFESLNTHF